MINTIRRAQEKDIPRLHDLLLQVLRVHHEGRPDIFKEDVQKYSDDQLEVLIRDDTRPIFVAENEEGYVVGYSFCILSEPADGSNLVKRKTLYIDDLCVDAQVRHQHIGQQLFNYVKQYARENGCYHLTLNVWECNAGAMKFYDSQGMNILKREMETIL